MGLSIHYSGQLKNKEVIPALMTEVTDICNSLGWSPEHLQETATNPLTGVYFTPEGCETVFLTFFPDGRMCSPINLMCKDDYVKHGLDPDIYLTASTKTQFAGIDAHLALLKFLRYLKEKYFESFDLMDEGNYWETGDENILRKQFNRYDSLLNTVADALGSLKKQPGESASSLADRIEEILIQKFGSTDPDSHS